jgi:uncharacterized protein (TIGR03437 family)
VIEAKTFEKNCADAQAGPSILFTPRPNDSGAAAVVEDVEFRNNIIRNVASGIHLLGQDYLYTPAPKENRMRRVRISNNVFENINGPRFGGNGVFVQVLSGTVDVTIEYNTVFQTGNIITADGDPSTRVIYRDNISRHNEYGVIGSGYGVGNSSIAHYFPDGVVTANVIAKEVNAPWNVDSIYPTGNFAPANLDAVGFVDLASRNYRLSLNSPYKGAGTNGSDPGCNIDALNAAMNGSSSTSPTPTPTPIASPTPTPSSSPGSNTPPSVSLTSPGNGSKFVSGTDITLSANAGDTDGSVSRVEFYRNNALMGSASAGPYVFVWPNAAKGTYSLTARAVDNSGGSTISPAVSITVNVSPSSVRRAKGRADTLAQQTQEYAGAADGNYVENTVLASDIAALIFEIEQAYSEFLSETASFGGSSPIIDVQIRAAALFGKATKGLAMRAASSPNIRNNLLRIASHLAIAEDLMSYGVITSATADQANATRTRANIVIGQARMGYGMSSVSPVAPSSLGAINGAGNIEPMISQTVFASLLSDGSLPYEVGGLSVTVNGVAVPMLYASPWGVKFFMPADMPIGNMEVVVSSQDGYVCGGLVNVLRGGTRIMTIADDDHGTAVVANSQTQTTNIFEITTPQNFGTDKRTRINIYATGVSAGASNTKITNDVNVGGKLRANFAETVAVEARLSNGRAYLLPVEFAGEQGTLPGVDQVTVRLISELKGAGPVQLTLIVAAQRSNGPTIFIR